MEMKEMEEKDSALILHQWQNPMGTICVQVQRLKFAERYSVTLLWRKEGKVTARTSRRRRSERSAFRVWTALRPSLTMDSNRAWLVGLDLVGHLARRKADTMSVLAAWQFIGGFARLYGWDGSASELRLEKEHFDRRRAADGLLPEEHPVTDDT